MYATSTKILGLFGLALSAYSAFAQTNSFENPILPVVGQCYVYETTSDGVSPRESQLCVKATGAASVEFDSGTVYDLTNFNEIKHVSRSYVIKTGLFSSKPGCWPTGQQRGATAYPLKSGQFSVDGLMLSSGTWQATFSQFNVRTAVIPCKVLGNEESCFESVMDAKDRANNGASHDTEASRTFVLTGPAKGWPLEIRYKSTPPGRLSVLRLSKVPS